MFQNSFHPPLDNDTVLDRPGLIAALVEDCSSGKAAIIGPVLSDAPNWGELPKSQDGLIDVNEVRGACMLFPRSTFNRLGMLDKKFSRRSEDTDYCFRAKLAGLRVVISPRVKVYHKGGGTYNWRKEQGVLRAFRRKYRNVAHLLPLP